MAAVFLFPSMQRHNIGPTELLTRGQRESGNSINARKLFSAEKGGRQGSGGMRLPLNWFVMLAGASTG